MAAEDKEATFPWCEACFRDKPEENTSPDSRFCPECYDFLLSEAGAAGLLTSKRKPWWVPRSTPIKTRARKNKSVIKEIDRLLKKSGGNGSKKKQVVTPSANRHQRHPLGVKEAVQKLNPSKTTTKKNIKAKNKVIFGHPGRPKKSLPENTIKKSKLSTRALAKKYKVSKSTISNIKNGQRVLV